MRNVSFAQMNLLDIGLREQALISCSVTECFITQRMRTEHLRIYASF
jgi:hypothetical protein